MTTDELRHDLHAYNDDATIPTRTAKALLAALDVVEACKADIAEGRDSHVARAYFEKQLPALRTFHAALYGESK